LVYSFNRTPTPDSMQSVNYTIIAFSALLNLFTLLDTIQILSAKSRELDLELVTKRNSEKNGTPLPNNFKQFWSFDFYLLIIKVYLPSLSELLSIVTLVLMMVSSVLNIQFDQQVKAIPVSDTTYIACRNLIDLTQRKQYVGAILVQLLVVALLKYMSEWIPSFYLFSKMIANFLKNAMSLGIMIIWILFSLSIYGLYTFGPHLDHMSRFSYMFANLMLLTLRNQHYLQTPTDYQEYNNLKRVAGSFTIIWYVLFTYILVTFILFNIITSIVTKCINETMEESKEESKNRKSLLSSLGAGKWLSKLGL